MTPCFFEAAPHQAFPVRLERKNPARTPGFFMKDGVTDGTRTHGNQGHNLGLYQLSYSHRVNLIK